MRVLLSDHAALGNNKSGVGYYASELIRCLRGLLGRDAVETWPGPWGMVRQRWWERQSIRYEYVARRPGWLPWVEKKFRGKFLSLVRKVMPPYDPSQTQLEGEYDLYHEPNYFPMHCDLPTVTSVHDLSALLHPEWHPADRVKQYELRFEAGLKRCAHLVAISQFGKGEIVKHLGWPADRVTVTYMGVRPGLRRVAGQLLAGTLRTLGLSEGYLLHVGTLEPRKNVLMLMRAYCSLPAPVRQRCPLVLAGGRGWNSDDAHAFLQSQARHKNVRWLGYVQESSFAALYSGARALLFPTFYEGFGMPTIEMMATGGAVVASSAGAVAETAGPRACLLDPCDADAWRHALLNAATDNDWIKQLSQGSQEAARAFTWERCAASTWKAYQQISPSAARKAA
jgi:alpha-1,3-rhamnosyl/mannosyltransferase